MEIRLAHGDALTEKADVLLLKYAQSFYGLDAVVKDRLRSVGIREASLKLKPGACKWIPSSGTLAASNVLFVGVEPLFNFGYDQIRAFAHRALTCLGAEHPAVKTVIATLHGVNAGLDEVEALQAQIAGFLEAVDQRQAPRSLQSILLLERDAARVKRLQTHVNRLLKTGPTPAGAQRKAHPEIIGLLSDSVEIVTRPRTAVSPTRIGDSDLHSRAVSVSRIAKAAASKPRLFVAMPFVESMEDVYTYGIFRAARNAGYVCERADLSSFTGDVMEWVKKRIQSASLVVADLTGNNSNVYLEIGYAWGCGIPTVLITRDLKDVKFDLRGQRCLEYKTIGNLEASLKAELRALKKPLSAQAAALIQ